MMEIENRTFAFRHNQRSRGVVRNHGRPSHLQFDLGRDSVACGNQNLALVEARVGFLDVFDLQSVRRAGL